jgi:AraC family transcriptional regulator
MKIETKTLPAMRLAYMRRTGPYGMHGIAHTWERFMGWCASRGLTQPRQDTYGLSLDDPATGAFSCWLCVPVAAQA